MDFRSITFKSVFLKFLGVLALGFIILKAYHNGFDANVYLHASQQFYKGENIYANNPFNEYLYSPLFAAILGIVSFLDYEYARIIWALLNTYAAIRVWQLTYKLIIRKYKLPQKQLAWWKFGVIISSVGFLIHNLNLGQINILILWLTFEGVFQIIYKKKEVSGSALIALGINIKIIPILAVYYLFLKRKYLAIFMIGAFTIVSLFLPIVIKGFQYNADMLYHWKNKINPSGEKYVFENNNRCNSLNATLPAYFHDFTEEGDDDKFDLPRVIVNVPQALLEYILLSLRVILALSVIPLVFYKRKRTRRGPLYFYWEFAYVLLITFIIFPHQMKYALVNILPSCAYLVLFSIKALQRDSVSTSKEKKIAYISLSLIFLLSIMGRDILGNKIIDLLDYYHAIGIITLALIPLLALAKPDGLRRMLKAKTDSSF